MQPLQAFFLVSFIHLFHHTIQDLGPAPSPLSAAHATLTPAPALLSAPRPSFLPSNEALPTSPQSPREAVGPSPASAPIAEAQGMVPQPPLPPEEVDSGTVRWCAVRDEVADCQHLISLLNQTEGYVWTCVQRDTIEGCLKSIKKGEADLINLDAGLAYIAFLNYSMKAIANEVYCNHAKTYDSVAIVSQKVCKGDQEISLKDFRGHRSCHGGYSTAAGWNYPIQCLKDFLHSNDLNKNGILHASDFFSEVCAPSEFEGTGECGGCGKENGSCYSYSYSGHSGAFRCLVEELGDIAFVKADTPLLYSTEGPYNQTWSTKSVREFMYLCPQGGCREINGYPGSCILGTIPANVIMAPNSISNRKRSAVQQTLLTATWVGALYTGNNGDDHLLSPRTQGISVVNQLTRSYLGLSAAISQKIHEQSMRRVEAPPPRNKVRAKSAATCSHAQWKWMVAAFSVLLELI